MKRLLLCSVLALSVAGCQITSPSRSSDTSAPGANPPARASQSTGPNDPRIPVPLLPRMAAHQRENMRDHLAAVQEIVAAVAGSDFAGVESSAARIGYSEQMGQMCERMGAGAPGFNALALNFHHTADTIVPAAKTRDSAATLKAVSATLQTCVACHAIYRQQIVNEATWKRIVSDVEKSSCPQPGKT
jgi:mono/diheme cytochrome c family protein